MPSLAPSHPAVRNQLPEPLPSLAHFPRGKRELALNLCLLRCLPTYRRRQARRCCLCDTAGPGAKWWAYSTSPRRRCPPARCSRRCCRRHARRCGTRLRIWSWPGVTRWVKQVWESVTSADLCGNGATHASPAPSMLFALHHCPSPIATHTIRVAVLHRPCAVYSAACQHKTHAPRGCICTLHYLPSNLCCSPPVPVPPGQAVYVDGAAYDGSGVAAGPPRSQGRTARG